MSQGITKENNMNIQENKVYDELPVQFENTTIIRDGPYINLTNDFGFSVECDMEHFICSYIVSGFYHNRTAGMYRFEPSIHLVKIKDSSLRDKAQPQAAWGGLLFSKAATANEEEERNDWFS